MSYGKIFPLGGSGGSTSPSGIAGAIQFSNGSAFASDAANFFWDDTNNRLGVGTNAPLTTLHVVGQTTFSDNALFSADFKYIGRDLNASSIRFSAVSSEVRANISTGGQFQVYNSGTGSGRLTVSSGGQTTISGGGATSATTSLLVQNSAGTELLRVRDDGRINAQSINVTAYPAYLINNINVMDNGAGLRIGYDASVTDINFYTNGGTRQLGINNNGQVFVGTSPNASAQFQVTSTTRGFLPPVMTTTQRTAIASPAVGLIVYQTDATEGLYIYKSTGWTFIV